MAAAARQALAGWRVVSAHEGALPCLPKNRPGCTPLPGLGFQVWHSPRGCAEVVIAFRGTNFDSQDDWTSNLRWFQSRGNRFDQYDQVREYIAGIIDRIHARCGGRIGRLVAVGHSLGGGLAQQAAYRDARIRRVYAFDPSFVTGYYDVRTTRRSAELRFLEIDRIYEHGEILAYPRFVLRHIYPPTECDPTIRSVRFNLLRGRSVGEHSIDLVTENLLRIAAERPAGRAAPRVSLPSPDAAARRALGCAPASQPDG
jgi:pimeloyl-ACP methyl ester carboxylesterase